MASEAIFLDFFRQLASRGFVQVLRRQPLVADGKVQGVGFWIVTDQAFIDLSVTLQQPRLHTGPKTPVNGEGNSALAVSDRISAFIPMGLDGVGVDASLNH